jgi:hypothetical protein
MKNLFLGLLIFVSIGSFGAESTKIKTEVVKKVPSVVECRFGQCQATAKSTGKQCLHCVSKSGDKFCYQH